MHVGSLLLSLPSPSRAETLEGERKARQALKENSGAEGKIIWASNKETDWEHTVTTRCLVFQKCNHVFCFLLFILTCFEICSPSFSYSILDTWILIWWSETKMETFWTQSSPAPSAYSENMRRPPNKLRTGFKRRRLAKGGLWSSSWI